MLHCGSCCTPGPCNLFECNCYPISMTILCSPLPLQSHGNNNSVTCRKQGNRGQAKYCLSKAITAEPENISLRFQLASIYLEVGDYQRAAESYEQIQKISPINVEALVAGAQVPTSPFFLIFFPL